MNTVKRLSLYVIFSILFLAYTTQAATITWNGGATGNWNDSDNWSGATVPGTGDDAVFNTATTVAITESMVVRNIKNNASLTINIAAGSQLSLSNNGNTVLNAQDDITIQGDGKLVFSRNGTSETDFSNITPSPGKTVTIHALIDAGSGAGLELNTPNGQGTLIVTNPDNAFTGWSRIYNNNNNFVFTHPDALGTKGVLFNADPATLTYNGTVAATLNKTIEISNDNAIFHNASTYPLTIATPLQAGSTRNLHFESSAAPIILDNEVDSTGTLLNINAGTGTLVIGPNASFGPKSALLLKDNSTVRLNYDESDNFSATLPPTLITGSDTTIEIPQTLTSSTLTISSLDANHNTSLNLVGEGIGTDLNRVFINNFSAGTMPDWFTVNGNPASYSPTTGVTPLITSATDNISALGPSQIKDGATTAVVINSAGTSGDITIEKDPTSIFSLTQAHAANPATVDLEGQTLKALTLSIAEDGNSLTLNNGTLAGRSTDPATLSLANNNPAAALNINANVTDLSGAALSISKFGTGSATLNGSNNYTGDTLVDDGKLLLSTAATTMGAITIRSGELDLSNTGTHNLGLSNITVGTKPNQLATLQLAGASLVATDPGFNVVSPAITLGDYENAQGLLYLDSDSVLQARLMPGSATGSVGAIYQDGGAVTNLCGDNNLSILGNYGHSYYRLASGGLTLKGGTYFSIFDGSSSLLEQLSGNIAIVPGLKPSTTGEVGGYYGDSLSTGKGNTTIHLSGGTMDLSSHSLHLGSWNAVGNDRNGGNASLIIENDAQLLGGTDIFLANRNGSPSATITINDTALFEAVSLRKGDNNSSNNNAVATINFNGGTLRTTSTTKNSDLFVTGTNNTPITVNVYEDGAKVETTSVDRTVSLNLPLQAPAGFGVNSITLTSPGSGYLVPPVVTLEGGDGAGATAVAEINSDTGTLTAIRVTSPGAGFTIAPEVVLTGGICTTPATAAATLGTLSTSGGFTKLGPGTLELAATNTYTGPTDITEGTLRLTAGNSTISPASTITVSGGTLDLGGSALLNAAGLNLKSGSVVNGTIATTVVKDTPGTTMLSARVKKLSPLQEYEAGVLALTPLIWYDPADTSTITTNDEGRVHRMLNKGTLGSDYDAIPYQNNGPMYIFGANSIAPNGAGLLDIDGNNAPMVSVNNLPLTGIVPRTLVAIMARDTDRAAVGIGTGSTGRTFEIGITSSKIYVSGIGDKRDTDITSSLPAADTLTFVAGANGYNSDLVRGMYLWRSSGETIDSMTHTWPADLGTGSAPLSISRRGTSFFRGKVGPVLLFGRTLTQAEITTLHVLLRARYLDEPLADSTDESDVVISAGTIQLLPDATSTIAAMGPEVWYDPSDASTLTVEDGGRVTAMLNKGTEGSYMDAAPKSDYQGQLLVSGGDSWSSAGLPMLKTDSNTTGLESANDTGISGTAQRTLITVAARNSGSDQDAIVSFGAGATRQLMELGDRGGGTVFGLFSDDLTTPTVAPSEQAHVYMMASIANNKVGGWRAGDNREYFEKTLSGNWATDGSTRLNIGFRHNAHRNSFRGQIGETLLFKRLLSEEERETLEDYLVAKWRHGLFNNGQYAGMIFETDTNGTLDLGGPQTDIIVVGSGTLQNGTAGNGFVISPAGDDAIGTLTLDNVSFAAGSIYRLTTTSDASDLLLVDGDLSKLSITSATTEVGKANRYLIAQGTITAKPQLSGFDSKYKLVLSGDNLYLTRESGTIILLR